MPTAVSKLNEFLESLRRFIASEAAINLAPADGKQPLWVHKATEAKAANPYGVIRCYSGPSRFWNPADRRSLQITVTGSSADDVTSFAEKLYAPMLDPETNRPLRHKDIPAFKVDGSADGNPWRIIFIDILQAPGIISVDDKGQSISAFNIDTQFVKT